MTNTIAIIGTGFVGLTTAACLAEKSNKVICIDNNPAKIESLLSNICPIYEPELPELLVKNKNNLTYTTDIRQVKSANIVIICVPTPSCPDGSCDLSFIFAVANNIAGNLQPNATIVLRSTAAIGATEQVDELIKMKNPNQFSMGFVPEFLAEGTAVRDFLNPNRVVIGCETTNGIKAIKSVYSFVSEDKLFITDVRSAELIKYASNAMLATRISFMNQLAALTEKLNINIDNVRKGMGLDHRIGSKFLYAGPGYGGSCFSKDIKALVAIGEANNVDLSILNEVEKANEKQKHLLAKKIIKHFGEDVKNSTIAVLGLAFKPNTNDMRDAPSLTIIRDLLDAGVKVKAYDPVVLDLPFSGVKICKDVYETCENVNAICIITEWEEFKVLDLIQLKQKMSSQIIFDGRNIINKQFVESEGWIYYGIGK